MMTIRTYEAIPGINLEPGIVIVPNDIGSHLVCHSKAVYIKHDHNPPENEWVPLEIPTDEPEPRPDPKRYSPGRRPAKGKRELPGVGPDPVGADPDGC